MRLSSYRSVCERLHPRFSTHPDARVSGARATGLAEAALDSLAQSFAGICMHLAVAAEGTPENAKDTLAQIERVIDLASFGLSEARRSAMSLRSDLIEELGLIEALKTLVKRSNIPGRLHCTFRSNFANDERVPVAFRQDLVRIAQEAISNAIRHAKSTTISVSLRVDPSGLVLKVKDNGCGMIRRPEVKDGFGFVNMRARVKKLNGCLDVRTAPGRGTSIMVTLPLGR
jgi:signal transduction histidine kinase